jgi:exonuclease SbcD
VDVVALTGDVVDRDNRFAEAFGPLERGIRSLCDAGIDVCAVAGNHDHDVLPRVARNLSADRFHFLGAEGQWQRVTLERAGKPALHVDGWSFPEAQTHVNPMDTFHPPPADGIPVIGILHTALDAPGTPYAPVSQGDLRRYPRVAWLLGHFHYSKLYGDDGLPYLLYTSQPQAMQIREHGAHGVWMLEVTGADTPPVARFVPTSTLRYDRVDVDLSDVDRVEQTEQRVIAAVREHAAAIAGESPNIDMLLCRLRLSGATPVHGELQGYLGQIQTELVIPCDGFSAHIESVETATRPRVDVRALAAETRGGAVALLARLLCELDESTQAGESEELTAPLVEEALRAIETVDGASVYAAIAGGRPDGRDARRDAARGLLREQGLLLLEALLAQKETA